MPDAIDNRIDAELAAADNLRQLMAQFRRAFAAADELLRAYADRFDSREDSGIGRVQPHSLTRLADEARAVWLLAERGYGMQAMVVASFALEIALTAAVVGFDGDRASKWLQWRNPKRAPWKVRELIRAGVQPELQKRTDGAGVSGWVSARRFVRAAGATRSRPSHRAED